MRKQLINLYAKHKVTTVKSEVEYEALHARYGEDTEFQWLRDQLDKMKIGIEVRIDPAECHQRQLEQAIRMLREYRHPAHAPKRDLLYELLVAIYEINWNADRLAYLKKALLAVRLRNDYFLSFTTRHSGEINSINTRYLHFIQKVLPNNIFTEKLDENLFAAAINDIFSTRAKGYFFPKSEEGSSIVIEELKREVNQSMVFVQIIQSQLFEYSKDNYCFTEWCWAKERFGNNENCIIYVSGEPDRDWLDILAPDEAYSDWHAHVKQKKVPPTPLHRKYDDDKIEETTAFFETIRDRDILGAWIRLEQNAP
jgi:hypothetical protein